jgi:predicted O-methyltransferase YrrM
MPLGSSFLFRLQKYLWYQRRASTKYYLHSPFVFQFYLNVLEGRADESIQRIGQLRKELASDKRALQTQDFGAHKFSSRTISEIEKSVAVSQKNGLVLYGLVKYFKPQQILELGTSIGISSIYLAMGNPGAKVLTLEGDPALKDIAVQNYGQAGITNIETMTGNFDHILARAIDRCSSIDLVFFDGNHTKAATLKYFHQCLEKANENSIFIFDDIYWSPEMAEAWEEIKAHPKISLTIDIFQFGICFFIKEKLAKENFVLRY